MYIHSLENKKVVKTNLKSWTTEISCITVALALMIFTSTMDRKDEIRSFNQYCKIYVYNQLRTCYNHDS